MQKTGILNTTAKQDKTFVLFYCSFAVMCNFETLNSFACAHTIIIHTKSMWNSNIYVKILSPFYPFSNLAFELSCAHYLDIHFQCPFFCSTIFSHRYWKIKLNQFSKLKSTSLHKTAFKVSNLPSQIKQEKLALKWNVFYNSFSVNLFSMLALLCFIVSVIAVWELTCMAMGMSCRTPFFETGILCVRYMPE